MRRLILIPVLLALAAPAQAQALTISQLPGRQGCFYMRSSDAGCTRSNGMQSANDAVVTPDGRFVYVVSGFEDYGALLTFRRDPATGALKQLAGKRGCISNDGRNAQADLDPKHGAGLKNRCGVAGPIAEAVSVAISPDGLTLYVLGTASFRRDGDSIAVFRRDAATGHVREVQCWARLGTKHCHPMPISEPRTLLVTPDGRELIVGGVSITHFAVGADGMLSGPRCVMSGASYKGDTDCGKSPAIDDRLLFTDALAASPDGATIYVAAGDFMQGQLLTFTRDPASGALTFQGCTGDPAAACAAGRALHWPHDVAAAPDGTGVYVAASYLQSDEGQPDVLRSSGLSVFAASPFGQLPGPPGCVVFQGRDKPDCSRGPGLYEAETIALTPDGQHAIAGFLDSAALLVLDRDPQTQQLTPAAGRAGCVRSPRQWVDRKVTLACNRGHGMYAPLKVVLSPDGRNAYLASNDGLAVFRLS